MSISYITIGITALISFLCFTNHELFNKLSFIPSIMKGKAAEYYRFLSHMFIHADLGHLAFNMITLFFFGPEVERVFQSNTEFIIFYLSAGILASLPSFQKQKNNPSYVGIGASGAISALMFVLVLYAPWSVIYIKFIIPVYYILFAVGYLIYCTYQMKHAKDNIAHDIHLWGALFGIAYMLVFHPSCISIFLEKIQEAPFLKYFQ
jgi:membrane associated rhomboid family serine protease